MIEDITFDSYPVEFILPFGTLGGEIDGYSMDGNNFDFEQQPIVFDNKEITSIFIT